MAFSFRILMSVCCTMLVHSHWATAQTFGETIESSIRTTIPSASDSELKGLERSPESKILLLEDRERLEKITKNWDQYSPILKKIGAQGKTISLEQLSSIPIQKLPSFSLLLNVPAVNIDPAVQVIHHLPSGIAAIRVADLVKIYPKLTLTDALEILRSAPVDLNLMPTLSVLKRSFPDLNSTEIKNTLLNFHDLIEPYSQLKGIFPTLTLQKADRIRELAVMPNRLIELKNKFPEFSIEDVEEIIRVSRMNSHTPLEDVVPALESKTGSKSFKEAFKQARFATELKRRTEEVYFHRLFPKLSAESQRNLDELEKTNLTALKEYFPDLELSQSHSFQTAPHLSTYRILESLVDPTGPTGISKSELRTTLLRLSQYQNFQLYGDLLATVSHKSQSKISLEMMEQLASLPEVDYSMILNAAIREPAAFSRFMKAGGKMDLLVNLALSAPNRSKPSSTQASESEPNLFDLALNSKMEAHFKDEVESACPTFDFQSSLPAQIRDQGDLGTCWAHTASDLLSQKICQRNNEFCGKSLSVADLSQAFRNIYSSAHSGSTLDGLEYGLKNGVCFEDTTTYFKNFNSFEQLRSCYHKHESPSEKGLEWMRAELQEVSAKISADKNQTVGVPLSAERLQAALESSESYPDFIYRLSIGPACPKTRIGREIQPSLFDGLSAEHFKFDFDTHSYLQRLQALKTRSENQAAFALGICAKRALKMGGDCGDHAITLIAAKYDHVTGKCMGFLRNSWGDSPHLNGWQDLSEILKFTKSVNFLRDPTTHSHDPKR